MTRLVNSAIEVYGAEIRTRAGDANALLLSD
jgi:hypothetical protein